jgi:hypothetical protein
VGGHSSTQAASNKRRITPLLPYVLCSMFSLPFLVCL